MRSASCREHDGCFWQLRRAESVAGSGRGTGMGIRCVWGRSPRDFGRCLRRTPDKAPSPRIMGGADRGCVEYRADQLREVYAYMIVTIPDSLMRSLDA